MFIPPLRMISVSTFFGLLSIKNPVNVSIFPMIMTSLMKTYLPQRRTGPSGSTSRIIRASLISSNCSGPRTTSCARDAVAQNRQRIKRITRIICSLKDLSKSYVTVWVPSVKEIPPNFHGCVLLIFCYNRHTFFFIYILCCLLRCEKRS